MLNVKQEQAVQLVRQSRGSGIVYASSVTEADQLYACLLRVGESATRFHGRLAAAERRANRSAFQQGRRRVMVATRAFAVQRQRTALRFVIDVQRLARLDLGLVLSVGGDRVALAFPERWPQTFMAEFVEPA
ncbi:MAG: helicase-related protein [Sphingomonadaceae bacterium]